EEELLKRYPAALITEAKGFMDRFSVLPEAAIALKSGVYAMHDVRNGGIFGALWELSQKIGVGLSVFLKEIPIRQETVEICEYFDLNPYELLSGGCLLMAAENGLKLKQELEKAGIPASVVGRTNGGNDKLVQNGDEGRYLTMPAQDEIWKVFAK
ncbi:MAG: hydrogenase maturation factor, partial [Lachnospiraceae bacterium]|nr:hydrogenase maturation factor [Lachnospiraceae bacterium]